MKQAQLPPSTAKGACKSNDMPPQTTTPSRFRASPRTKESPRAAEVVNGVPANRAKSVPPDLKNNSKAKRVLVLNKPKSSEDVVGSQKGKDEEVIVVGRSVNRQTMEQFARPRRKPVDASFRRSDDGPDRKKNELQEKLELSENLVKNLQSELLSLKAELDEVKNVNVELESQNRKLTEDLAAAEANLVATSINPNQMKKGSNGEQQSTKFKDIQKLIANKLERSMVKKEAVIEFNSLRVPSPPPPQPTIVNATLESRTVEKKTLPCPTQLPPPPPPPPPQMATRPLAKASNIQKPPAVVDLFQSLKKEDGKKDSTGSSVHHKAPVTYLDTHSSIVGEIRNRSTHLLAIRTDIETKGEFINGLIQKVLTTNYTDIEDVIKFVDWLDGELSSLADERAVLKHFNWPERKADALREAAVEYHDLKMLEDEISSYRDEPSVPCGMALRKMATLLDKSEQSIQRLTRFRDSVTRSHEGYRIPTAWMLDTGIISKIKQSSMSLVKLYIRRVTREIESVRNTDRESNQESLVLQGVHFAYRAHQFTGGLDSETLCALEEIRRRVPGHTATSQELLLLAGIPSS